MTTPDPGAGAAWRWSLAALAAAGAIAWGLVAAAGSAPPGRTVFVPLSELVAAAAPVGSSGPPRPVVMAGRPPRNPDIYPCSACHEPGQNDLNPRPMTINHVGLELHHGASPGWCFDCHAREQRDELVLADGSRAPIDDSIRLCAQCHGPQQRDWTHGAHGGMTGAWAAGAGERVRRTCVTCHDPHAPAFRALPSVFAPRPSR